ncbi:MarR family winged helix-turn-helix transcriptional regulator [Clostridium drakei]|uniref:MarR family transcriptional regulator n=1 Tax=Clostridium drakei TaxID=332101 RepID=A0A2U8DP32_9CLOT|nr:MarR family transcriptional regulator [Clostridium drakei]AWI04211.1 MarR family transcriptional regulator [Clostridium drakei]
MELNECINFLLTRAHQTVFQHVKSNLVELDVTPVQYGILKCLWTEDCQTPKQIGEILSLDSSTITGILDRMESKELVKRVANQDDRRTLKIMLTERGSELQVPVEKIIEEVNKYFLEIFTDDQQTQLKEYLRLIANRHD